jgi:ATPase subunit of ABC transporter with duplicated ATPase domains
MIAINNLTFEIGARALYDEANWHIKPGEKIGLIGANGTGKTTLLKIIVGDYKPTSGTISMAKDLTMGYLNQDLLSYSSDKTIVHVAMEAFERQNQLHDEIENLLKKLETDYTEDLLHKLSDKQHEFELLDGYNIEYKAREILAGLGFSDSDCARKLNTFSGGWRMRVMLAKILLQAPDILLLDEPTNHLDLPSIQWLEDYLKAFNGAIIIVSHDRWFLDKVINRTVESRKGKLTVYAGNYTFYLEEKAQREEIQRGEFKNQQSKIKQEERLIERFRAKASKAKMAQSRIKMLDKMERVDDVDDDNPSVNFAFRFSKQSGRHVITLEDIVKKYPAIDILNGGEAVIEKGDKIALIGANGKGKSTLLRIVVMKNSGFELALNISAVQNNAFSYNITLAGAYNENKFISFSNDIYKGAPYQDVAGLPAPGSPGNIQRIQEGQSIGGFYMLKSAGVDATGTLLVYRKDGTTIQGNKATNDDKQFVGNGLPKFTSSLGNTFKYKNWDLSVFLRGVFGYKIFNTDAFYIGTPSTQADANVLKSAYDSNSKYSKLTNSATTTIASDYFLENGNFVKIDNVALGYSHPVTSKYIHRLRLYATARNLHTFTKYTGSDPDQVSINGLTPGVNTSLNYYPSTLQLVVGGQLTF